MPSCPSPAVALRKAGPASCQGSRAEPALYAGDADERSRWCVCRRAGELNSSGNSQAQIWGFELAHLNLSSIDELLECMKVPAGSTDLKLQDLHDIGQQQDIREESQ